MRVGPRNGLDHECVVALDNILTLPIALLGRTIWHLADDQERELARAMVLAFDLDLPLLGDSG